MLVTVLVWDRRVVPGNEIPADARKFYSFIQKTVQAKCSLLAYYEILVELELQAEEILN